MLTKTELDIVTEAVDSAIHEITTYGEDFSPAFVFDELHTAYHILKEAQEKALIEEE